MRRRRRELGALAATAALALLLPAAAGAHAIVRPSASRPADLQLYTLTVPNERDVPTVEVALKIPEGIDFVLIEETPGWRARVERRNDRVDVVRFTGGSIEPDFFAAFRFIARNPVEEGELVWPVTQRYQGGEVVSWIGPSDSDTPASRTRIAESAPASDVVDVLGGGSSDEPGTAGPTETESTATVTLTTEPEPDREATAASDDGDGAGTLAVALGAAALLVAIAALVVGLRRGRQ